MGIIYACFSFLIFFFQKSFLHLLFRLKEANKRKSFMAAIKDLEFWLGEVETLLSSEDYGRDLTSIENLLKKQQLIEADINAHTERVAEMNAQADSLLDTEQFDNQQIEDRRKVFFGYFILIKKISDFFI